MGLLRANVRLIRGGNRWRGCERVDRYTKGYHGRGLRGGEGTCLANWGCPCVPTILLQANFGRNLIPPATRCCPECVTPGSSQTLPTGQPAGQIKKLKPKEYISVHTQFNNVCTSQVINIAICTLHISCTELHVQVCTWYVHVYEIQNWFIIV